MNMKTTNLFGASVVVVEGFVVKRDVVTLVVAVVVVRVAVVVLAVVVLELGRFGAETALVVLTSPLTGFLAASDGAVFFSIVLTGG